MKTKPAQRQPIPLSARVPPVLMILGLGAGAALMLLGIVIGLAMSGSDASNSRSTNNFQHAKAARIDFDFTTPGSPHGWRGGRLTTVSGRSVLTPKPGGKLQLSAVALELGPSFSLTIEAAAEAATEIRIWLQAHDGTLYLARSTLPAGRYHELHIRGRDFRRWPGGDASALPAGVFFNLTIEPGIEDTFGIAGLVIHDGVGVPAIVAE